MPRLVPPVLSLVVTCLLGACAHEEPLPAPDVLPPEAQSMPQSGRFVLTGIRQPIVELITETGIQGPDVNLGRYPSGNGTTACGARRSGAT